MVEASKLEKEFAIGLVSNGIFIKDYALLRSNGIAERVFTDKNTSKPYTWMAEVISIAVKRIGDVAIGADARNEYAKSESVTIPPIVKEIPFADANSMIIEIHRTVWKNLIRNQESICKYCGNDFHLDIDLNRIDYTTEQKEQLAKLAESDAMHEITVKLPQGFLFEGFKNETSGQYDLYKDIVFDEFTFRVPTLGDAITNERTHTDTIMFWRKIAFDCLIRIYSSGNSTELPMNIKNMLSLKLFNELMDRDDLAEIRTRLRDEMPSLPFYYEEECPNPNCKKETPVTIEATSFFSD